MAQESSKIKPSTLLLWILLLGFALRLYGVGFGLPSLYHADEPIIVNHALAYGAGDLNPHFFKIPPLVSYLLFICYGIFFLAGKLTGFFQSTTDFENLFFSDPTLFYLVARISFGVLAGTASIYVLYRLVQKNFSTQKAALAAALFSVCYLHVRESHYIYTDIPLILVMILSFFPILAILKENNLKNYLLAGLGIGVATAVKYNGAVLIIPYAAAVLWNPKRQWKYFLLSALLALAVYSVLNPYTWLDFSTFAEEIKQQAQAQAGTDLLHHLQYSLLNGVGPAVLILSFVGLWVSWRKQERVSQVMGCFIIGYYLILVKSGQAYDRYVLPLVPWVIVLASNLSADLFAHKKRRAAGLLLILSMFLPNLMTSIHFDRIKSAKDTRTLAEEWVESKIPSESKIAVDGDEAMPRLAFSKMQLEQKRLEAARTTHFSQGQLRRLNFYLSESASKSRYQLYFLREGNSSGFLFARPSIPYNLKALRQEKIEYVVALDLAVNDPERMAFYKELNAEGELLQTFTPYRPGAQLRDKHPLLGGPFLINDLKERERDGHILRIYKLK